MPKRTDLKRIMILGSGPIVIGQACEFDYSGVQACKVLREDGYYVILVNSNPATIMTDPELADETFIEPLQWQALAAIIEQTKPDAILPTMGGQTALNCALDLDKHGVLEKYQVALIGASKEAIDKAEDREKFRDVMTSIGLKVPKSAVAHSLEEALQVQAHIGYPTIIRPSFTLGGSGSGIAYNREEFTKICQRGLDISPTHELMIEESLIGWKEFEFEVVCDEVGNGIIVCSIENFDPMGVHTGDSITVAPALTLTDKEYQRLRQYSIDIVRAVGVATGGANVQFGVHPTTGDVIIIEMNPRVSRSSALASKATGFPIAKLAAKLAVGYTLDECTNDITGDKIPASFEPSIDYVVVKIPRFNFEKFPQASPQLSTQMKSVGESMAIGSQFREALLKAICGLDVGKYGFESTLHKAEGDKQQWLKSQLRAPSPDRLWHIADGFRLGMSVDDVHQLTHITPWFLAQMAQLVAEEETLKNKTWHELTSDELYHLKRQGFSDRYLALLLQCDESEIYSKRQQYDIKPVFKRIDSCAGEYPTATAFMYATYQTYCESKPTSANKIMILGSGPNRIGQGIEFDYCCVQAAQALREVGYETIMLNCNPETVSTDFDVSDRLYFEPITFESVMAIVEREKPQGVIVQLGGQTPLKIANDLQAAGVVIIGTSPQAIDEAEDRERFQKMIQTLNLKQPSNAIVSSPEQALQAAKDIGYPIVVRPSYVLGGRAMKVVFNDEELSAYCQKHGHRWQASPLLLDHYLNEAIEVDVDAVCDGKEVWITGIMEHIEQAGIHSGDSACVLPPMHLSVVVQRTLKRQITAMALHLGVKGLVNAQFAIQQEDIYVLEVNPRASRTVPFVSKAIGLPITRIATRCMVGQTLKEQDIPRLSDPAYYAVKLPVFPFNRFDGVDTILGPEMRSTGEVMGIAQGFGQAYAKAQLAAGTHIKRRRQVFVSVKDSDKVRIAEIGRMLCQQGFRLLATRGTAQALFAAGVAVDRVNKVHEGQPHIVDMIKNDEVDFIVNTTEGQQAILDSQVIRQNALVHRIAYTTTLEGARAMCLAMKYEKNMTFKSIQALTQ